MQHIVLGMHRSGTSALARALHLLGCHFGPPEALLGSNQENPLGYWERRDVLRLNQLVLGRFGACAYRVGHLQPDTFGSRALPELESSARRILARLEPHRPWVIKDPRLCLTLPFWRPLLTDPICVLVYRRPLEVARSLQTREALPAPYAIALWERYNLDALHHSRGLPRVLIGHRALMERPFETLATLHESLLALGATGLRMPTREMVAAAIDSVAYRERWDDAPLEAQHLNLAQARLLDALSDRSALDWEQVPALSRGAQEILLNYTETIDPAFLSGADDEAELASREVEPNRHGEQLRSTLTRLLARLQHVETRLWSQPDVESIAAEVNGFSVQLQAIETRLEAAMTRQHAALAEGLAKEYLQLRLDHEQIFRAQDAERRDHRSQVLLLEGWIRELDQAISRIRESRTWKLGSALRRFAERFRLRPSQPLAFEHRDDVMRRFADWEARRTP